MTEIEKTGVEIEDISESEAYKNAFRVTLNYNGGSESVLLGDFLNCLKYMYSVKEKEYSSTRGAGLQFNNISDKNAIVVHTPDGGFYLKYNEIQKLLDEYNEYIGRW